MSPHGPTDHRLRLTAMALFLHMNNQAQCWVGQKGIAERTGFGERSVRRHVQSLERAGWIQRSFVKDAGKAWRKTVYTASVPDSISLPAANEMPEHDSRTGKAAANNMPHLTEGAANEMPEHDTRGCLDWKHAAANPGEGAAKLNEGAANLIAGAANRWPMNRDLEQGIEPVLRTSSAIPIDHRQVPFKSPGDESRKPKNAHSFEQINDRIERVFVELGLQGSAVSLSDYGLITKLTGYTEQQVRTAIRQLIDRKRLPIQSRRAMA